jgi:hypothetical protein
LNNYFWYFWIVFQCVHQSQNHGEDYFSVSEVNLFLMTGKFICFFIYISQVAVKRLLWGGKFEARLDLKHP